MEMYLSVCMCMCVYLLEMVEHIMNVIRNPMEISDHPTHIHLSSGNHEIWEREFESWFCCS